MKIPNNPCGAGVPNWPRLMSIPCAAAYLSRTTGFVEARLRSGEIPFHIKDAEQRVIDRLELGKWIAKQPKQFGKLRHPVRATEARKAAETKARIFEPFFTTKEQGRGKTARQHTLWHIYARSPT